MEMFTGGFLGASAIAIWAALSLLKPLNIKCKCGHQYDVRVNRKCPKCGKLADKVRIYKSKIYG
jgi:hypothetical protein